MENQTQKSNYLISASIIVAGVAIASGIYLSGSGTNGKRLTENEDVETAPSAPISAIEQAVLPSDGVTLPAIWGDLGQKLIASGAIDKEKFKSLYRQRGQFTGEYENLLNGNNNGKLKITEDNSGYLLNLLWALGLANKNSILENGEMADRAYGGAQNFASTGGWTMARGGAMDHYGRHKLLELTPEQQALVEGVSLGIYRPCCGNSTHFPDCNHGMAMLGLLELMASQGAGEQDMYKAALAVNSFWFPDTYLTIATYMKSKGVEWKDADPREILSEKYSSGAGYAQIAALAAEVEQNNGNSGSEPANAGRRQSGCGV